MQGEKEMLFKPLVMNNLYNQVRSYLRIDTEMKERKYGFKDACSRLVELDETIQLPSGYRLINGPKEDTMQGTGADLKARFYKKETGWSCIIVWL